jgi:bifunctional DNA-binding transcriptional regulator/antitoxin component of YhaV-PrlF toxin-antitoxin module
MQHLKVFSPNKYSLAILIPKRIADACKIKKGDILDYQTRWDGKLIIYLNKKNVEEET